MKNVGKYIQNKLKSGPLHFSLIDPDKSKMSAKRLKETAKMLNAYGTDAIMVGGSTNIETSYLDTSIRIIKNQCKKPIILFPGGLNGISKYADAIFFMSLLNSMDSYWIVGAQKKGALIIKKMGIEPLSMAYLIIEPGMEVGRVGKADLIKQNEHEKAVTYALAAQYMGMEFVYLEAGSGATSHVPEKMIRAVKNATDVNLIVGGGIRSPDTVKKILRAGADIIVTGTAIENNENVKSMITEIRNFKG